MRAGQGLCAEGGRGGGSTSFHLFSRFCPGGQPGVLGVVPSLCLCHTRSGSPHWVLVPRYSSTPRIPWPPLPSCPERPDFSIAGLAGPNPCLGAGFGAGSGREEGKEGGPSKPPVAVGYFGLRLVEARGGRWRPRLWDRVGVGEGWGWAPPLPGLPQAPREACPAPYSSPLQLLWRYTTTVGPRLESGGPAGPSLPRGSQSPSPLTSASPISPQPGPALREGLSLFAFH